MTENGTMSVGGDSGANNAESAAPVASTETSQEASGSVIPDAASPNGEPAVASAPVAPVAAAPVAPPAYQPNFKYRAFQEEKEFPEWCRPLISSKEHEENLRSLFCKADGLDGLKPKYQELRQQHNDLATKWNTLRGYAQNDLHSFFEATGIDRNRLVDWIIKSDEIMRDPDKKQAFEARRQAEQREREIQQRFESQQEQFDQLAAQNHQMQLRTVMGDPDVSAFAKAFDAKLGDGAFLAHVYNVGNGHFLETKKNLSPAEATAIVIRQYHRLVGEAQTQQAQAPTGGGVASDGMPVAPPPAKPIPSLGNGSAHSGKTRIRNLDDLYKRAEQLGA